VGNAVAVRSDGAAIVAPALAVVAFDDPPRVASICDTDNTRLVRVAPGQLLTLYGTKLSPVTDAQPSGPFPVTFNGITVRFNGIAGPILYASGDQVNVQVPFEIDGQAQVTMQVTGELGAPAFSESFVLGVKARVPSLLISAANFAGPLFGSTACDPGTRCVLPLAYNDDGTLNGPDHPAAAGSVVTVFVNGGGVMSPMLMSGSVAPMQEELSPGVDVGCCFGELASVVSTESIAGSSTTVMEVRVRVTNTSSRLMVPLEVMRTAVRGDYAVIWTVGVDQGQ